MGDVFHLLIKITALHVGVPGFSTVPLVPNSIFLITQTLESGSGGSSNWVSVTYIGDLHSWSLPMSVT